MSGMFLAKTKLALLSERNRFRLWWKSVYWWSTIAVCLWPVAYFVPQHLFKIGHHPPVGTYIALAGLLVAAVTLRKDPPLPEKACWIVLFTLLTVAEIRNLYIADREQAETFSTIQGGLDNTKKGLDQAVKDLSKVEVSLGKVSGHVDAGVLISQKAENTATEVVNDITGGQGFGVIQLATADILGKKTDILTPVLTVKKTKILRGLSMHVVDYKAFQKMYRL